MNVFDAQAKLIEWFQKNDVVEIERDFLKIVIVSVTEEDDKAALIAALNILKENGFVREVENKKKKFWALVRPLSTLNQRIEISYLTARGIAQMVNSICERTGDEKSKVDITNIQEKDVMNLLLILGTLLQEQQEKEIKGEE